MRRISTPTRVIDKFGPGKDGFTNGDAVSGIPSTDLEDVFFDSVQEELANVVEGAGLTLDPSNRAQVLAGLRAMFAKINGDSTKTFQIALATASNQAVTLGQDTGRLLNIQAITASGTYTPTSGTTKARVRLWGGGGGGGGTSSTAAAGGGGGGAGYAEGLFAITGTVACTIGAAGTAGTTAPTAGGAGGTTSFGALMSATGGGGGGLSNGAGSGAGGGGAPGFGTGGYLDVTGQGGTGGPSSNSGGQGGGAWQSSGAPASANSQGPAGQQPGAGGAGGSTINAGGNGFRGLILIEEYGTAATVA